ncbi:glycosyltransferase family 4 protein [Candidatus Darwinibacter acetoxidans]
MKRIAVHQFHAGSAYGDGITNAMFFIQRVLRQIGYRSEIYCVDVDIRLRGRVRHFTQLRPKPDDVVFIHYSMGHDQHKWIDQIPASKVLVYHNITPSYLLPSGSIVQRYAERGREQIRSWGRTNAFNAAIADSPFNAAELESAGFSSIRTIPLLVDINKIRNHSWSSLLTRELGSAITLLFIGRWSEHKGQLELVRMMNVLRELSREPVRLIVAGGVASPSYFEQVNAEIRNLRLEDNVLVFETLADEDVYALYRIADLYISLSQHEGFGMPLVEAMAFDIPVAAFAAGAIPSTLGTGGLLLKTRDSEYVAASAHLILQEPWLRTQVVHAQRRELQRFERKALITSLQTFLCELGLKLPEVRPKDVEPDSLNYVSGWRIEGPFDSSYSLAIVNRELAKALAHQGVSIALASRDGPGPFEPDKDFLIDHPEIAAIWRASQDDISPCVGLRNLYPPIVSDLRGELRGLACYAWEESGFPAEYVNAFNARLNLIGTTSRFVAKVLRDNGVHVPIRVVGDGIDQILHQNNKSFATSIPFAQELGLGGRFCFLHISSCLPRKGVDVLLSAWGEAFARDDNVILVIKAAPNQHHNIENDVIALDQHYPDHAPVVVINRTLSDQQTYELIRAADVMVCPSRGEGFGLPLAEALVIGKPVIATSYGGQMDFCSDENAWLCDYEFAYAKTHLSVPNSVWVEPRLDSLVLCLRAARAATPEERARRAERGRKLVSSNFTWDNVASRLRKAVEQLRALDAQAIRLPKIGWVSTWNSRCGIAAYSQALSCEIPPDCLMVFANRGATVLEPDHPSVARCWEQGWSDPLDELYDAIKAAKVDAVVIQFNFGFFNLTALEGLINQLTDQDIPVYVLLHSTADVEKPDISISLSTARQALSRARRLLVHSVHDLNRLKKMGLEQNVALFPFGAPPPYRGNRLSPLATRYVIATFGYLLPHKGLRQLIEAFAAIRAEHPNSHLLMLNALYPVPESETEYSACKAAISAHNLQQHVTLTTDYLSDNDIIVQLAHADIIVYPYQNTQESASAAIRLGLSSLTPVACTPLPIFADVGPITHRLPGISPAELAAGISRLLSDRDELLRFADGQRAWAETSSWPVVSRRLYGMVRGEFIDGLMKHT